MKSRWIVVPLGIALLFAAKGLRAAKEDSEKKEFKATCPVSGKAAGESHVVKLKNGESVYFCCDNCPKAFEASLKDKTTLHKFDLPVNRQLLETGQIKQVACPLTGKPVNKEQTVEVGTTEVAFCCDKCKAKYEKATDEEKLKLLFSKAAMNKGFKSAKGKEAKKKKDAA